MTTEDFNKLDNYDKLSIISQVPQPIVTGIHFLYEVKFTHPAKFYVVLGKHTHRIIEYNIRYCKEDDYYVIHLSNGIGLKMEKGDNSLLIVAK